MNKGKKILKIFVLGVLGLLALGGVIMLLWNWLVPHLFSGRQITFWQALGLFLLARVLFGGWAGGRCRNGCGAGWKNRSYEKLSKMSPEERERFKRRMSEKWCYGGIKENPKAPSGD